jgi:hypothetical protein
MMAIFGDICCSPTLEWRKERGKRARWHGGGTCQRWKVAGEGGTTDEIRAPARKRHFTLAGLGDMVLSNHEIFTFGIHKYLSEAHHPIF